MARIRRLLPILGVRPAWSFGAVGFLVASLLAAVHLTSRYALKQYVDDQLRRIPWDLVIYQKGPVGRSIPALSAAISRAAEVTRAERLAFLRAEFPPGGEVAAEVDEAVLSAPWVSLLAASDRTLLPPQFDLTLNEGDGARTDSRDDGVAGAVLAFVGPERAIGRSFLALQGARTFRITLRLGGARRVVFEAPLRKVVRIDRDELNRWLLDRTGSVSFVPHIGVLVLMPFDVSVLERFDAVAAGVVPDDLVDPRAPEAGHVQRAEYEPEVAYLVRLDRERLISGWDLGGSRTRVAEANRRVYDAARAAVAPATRRQAHRLVATAVPVAWTAPARSGVSTLSAPWVDGSWVLAGHPVDEDERLLPARLVADSTTGVLLDRMHGLQRLIGLVTVLVALPLVWVAWLLAGTLTRLLMLNERRTLGLLRLRGVAGDVVARTLLVAILAGGAIGGGLGLVAGTLGPLALYEGGRLSRAVVWTSLDLATGALVLLASLAFAGLAGGRLVRYAVSLAPAEAVSRVAPSEPRAARVRFGWWHALALAGGAVVLGSWMGGMDIGRIAGRAGAAALVARLIDLAGLPLFVYGVATLAAAHHRWLAGTLGPLARAAGGALSPVVFSHLAAKPHRALAFLLVTALMTSVSLYPSIAGGAFADKARRGAHVQIGADWQVIFHAPDLAEASALQGELARQVAALGPALADVTARFAAVRGVDKVAAIIEGVLPNFYMPEYGMRGVPAYFIEDLAAYRAAAYGEPELGLTEPFDRLLGRLARGEVLVSPTVARFKRLQPGRPLRVGVDGTGRAVTASTGGVLASLPGLPPRTVTDRQGYVAARIDYLNQLASDHAYVVSAATNPGLAGLRLLVPRVIVLVSQVDGADRDAVERGLHAAAPVPPLELNSLEDETGKVASDMFVSLALANLRIYLFGGLALAVIAIVAVAAANFVEDRTTLALLRLRGAEPALLWRFVLALLVVPAFAGLVVGAVAAGAGGYAMADHVWDLREIRTVVQLLPTRLVVSSAGMATVLALVVLVFGTTAAASAWAYRRTARERLQQG